MQTTEREGVLWPGTGGSHPASATGSAPELFGREFATRQPDSSLLMEPQPCPRPSLSQRDLLVRGDAAQYRLPSSWPADDHTVRLAMAAQPELEP
jgi:hypothetical protein